LVRLAGARGESSPNCTQGENLLAYRAFQNVKAQPNVGPVCVISTL
jgi:hypothetical protein